MQAQTKRAPTKRSAPMSDDQIREHLELTTFHGVWVSQRNIDDVRKAMKIPKPKAVRQ
jgi:hypothetical protein